ncbi:hypothetical protein B0H66DRAFT_379971 [Apodospora peruviana]|uniref:Azaphilone pigments biosynthesis cluster protein L N-terminal domain-containing protein n=1 Tax=Apodospora peruviana TaxID=516989 RepID=A0AAE0HTR4_9PEZI|nr:hypothetical protein B0H66DRAFT_379971 [Apodospora peruviana]
MEAVGAAASIIALVQALKSAKLVHETIAAVRDGPQNVRHLVDEVAQLQSILERISALPTESMNDNDAAALTRAANRCAVDMVTVESKLQRLDLSTADRRSGRFWKRVKTVVGEKGLEQIRQTIQGHVLMLNVQFNLAQASHMSASSSQLSQIVGLLNQLRSEVAGLHTHGSDEQPAPDTDTKSTTINADSHLSVQASDPSPDESIFRLISLVNETERTVESDDAVQLIDDLQSLLESAQQQHGLAQPPPTSLAPASQEDEAEDVTRELKLLGGLIRSAPTMEINKNSPRRLLPVSPGITIQQARKRRSLHMDGGVFTIDTNVKRRKRDTNPGGSISDKSEREFVGNITFRPTGQQSMLRLTVQQSQNLFGAFMSVPRLCVNNIIPSSSTVFEYAKQGKTGEILSLVQSGKASFRDHDENGLSLLHYAVKHSQVSLCKLLVQNGLDVDEIAKSGDSVEFTPLHLAYSTNSRYVASNLDPSVELSAALLQAGADPSVAVKGWVSVLHLLGERDAIVDHQVLSLIFKYGPHFVDPELRSPHIGRTTFLAMCEPSPMNITSQGEYHTSGAESYQAHIKALELLLRNGSSVHERDSNGRTCLHTFFDDSVRPPSNHYQYRWKRLLTFLISRGANVYATDYEVRPVSAAAYEKSCRDVKYGSGSYRGDLWDSVLDACGYDILEFRKGEFPRRAEYTSQYTRADFEDLWKGREERCPYWNDLPWHGAAYMVQHNDEFVHTCWNWGGCELLDAVHQDNTHSSDDEDIDDQTSNDQKDAMERLGSDSADSVDLVDEEDFDQDGADMLSTANLQQSESQTLWDIYPGFGEDRNIAGAMLPSWEMDSQPGQSITPGFLELVDNPWGGDPSGSRVFGEIEDSEMSLDLTLEV